MISQNIKTQDQNQTRLKF